MAECRTKEGRPKVRYLTRAAAKRAARQFPADALQPYRCSVCEFFHLGHYPVDMKARTGLRARHRQAAG